MNKDIQNANLLKTLIELGDVTNKHVLNFIILNIKESCPLLKNVEITINVKTSTMYLLLDYPWYAFNKKADAKFVSSEIQGLFPYWNVAILHSKKKFYKILEFLKAQKEEYWEIR